MLEIVKEKYDLVVIMWAATLESINQLLIPKEETTGKKGKEHQYTLSISQVLGTLWGFLLTPLPLTWYQRIPN